MIRAAPTSHQCPAPLGPPEFGVPWCPTAGCHIHALDVGAGLAEGCCFHPMPKQTQIFQGHFLLSMVFTPLWRKSSAWRQLKSMHWQPRLISHPHAIFLNYVIRKILLTVVLNPLETRKFHFPCIYSSSLTTCWFFYSFLLLVEIPSQCNSLLLDFDTNQNWDFCDLYVPMSRTISVFISQKWGHCSYFISIPNQIELIVFFGVFKHWIILF